MQGLLPWWHAAPVSDAASDSAALCKPHWECPTYPSPAGNYRVDDKAGKALLDSLMWK